jgi:hypothetical protein
VDVGRLTARLDAVLDDGAFDRFDRRLEGARREAKRDVVAQLRGDAEVRQFDKFGNELDKAQREARKGAKAKLDADVDTRGFDKYNRALKDTDHEHGNFVRGSGRVKGAFGSLFFGGAGIAAGAGALYGLAKATKFVVGEFGESQKVAAQTNAVLKSTGSVAGVSAKDVDSLATSISKKTGIDDEAVASGENLLLTFTNVRNEAGKGNDVFSQTTKLAADMSTALGIDLSAANMQLGKALNDPEKGMTRLQRSGVTFTKAQKDQVAALQESGDTLGAQKIILAEVRKEFGGSAEAAGKTLPGALNRMRVALGNVAEEIGGKLSPYVVKAADFIEKLASGGGKGSKSLDGLRNAARGVGSVFKTVFAFVGSIIDDNRDTIDKFVRIAKTNFNALIGAVRSIGKAAKDVFGGEGTGFGSDLRKVIRVIGQFVAILAAAASNVVRRILPGIVTAFRGLATIIRGVVRIISGIFSGDFSKVWAGVKDIFSGAIKLITGMLRAWTAPVRAALAAVGRVVGSAIRSIVHFFAQLPGDAWRELKKALSFVARFARELASDGANAGKRFIKRVIDFVSDLPGDVWTALKRTLSRVTNFAGDLVDKGASAGKRFVSRTIDFVEDLPGKVWDRLVSTLDKIGGFERKAISAAARTGKGILSSVVDGIRSMPGRVMDFFGSMLDRVRSIPGKLVGIFQGIGRRMADTLKKTINGLIPDTISFGGTKVKGHTVIPKVTIHIPQLKEGGIVGPGFGGMRAFIAGEGRLPEWVISQEGDRNENVGWAKNALETLTGKRVALHAGGMGSGPGTKATILARKWQKDVDVAESKIGRKQRILGQKEQAFDLSQEVYIKDNADGTQTLDNDAIQQRAGELKQLGDYAAEIAKDISDLWDDITNSIQQWKTALRLLKHQRRTSKRKYKSGINDAINEANDAIASMTEKAFDVGGADKGASPVGGDWLDASLQAQGYYGERAEVLGTSAPPGPTPEAPARFGGTYLSDPEDAELGGLLEAQATAGTTADTTDDTSTAAALRSFYQRRLDRGGLTQQERIELLGLIGLPPEAATTTGGGGSAPIETATATPSPLEIATTALAALDQFQSSRGDLFGQFGSNFSAGGISGAAGFAAGARFFGAVPGAASIGQASGGGVTINQKFDAPPPDPHSWTRGVDFELRAAI